MAPTPQDQIQNTGASLEKIKKLKNDIKEEMDLLFSSKPIFIGSTFKITEEFKGSYETGKKSIGRWEKVRVGK